MSASGYSKSLEKRLAVLNWETTLHCALCFSAYVASRGSKMGKSGSLPLAQPMKAMLAHFGMEWCEAPGEAEAELACLNREGLIDAIITDDCDDCNKTPTAFIFGAKTVIRNSSLELSGKDTISTPTRTSKKANPALDKKGKESKHHVRVSTADELRAHGFTRGALVLFALLAGGDYDSLLDAFERYDKQRLGTFLLGWRAEINTELRTNSRGFLKQRHLSLTLPVDFPDLQVLANYVGLVVFACPGLMKSRRPPSAIETSAAAPYATPEWGHHAAIIKRFRTLLWKPAVMHVLRRAALLVDDRERDGPGVEAMGTPATLVRTSLGFVDPAARYAAAFVNQSDVQHRNVPDPHPLIEGVVNARNHVSTDEMLEFRVESGIKGRHKPPGGEEEKISKKPTPEAESTLRMWIPGVMLQRLHAAMVEEYFEGKIKSKDKEKAPLEDESESDPDTAPSSQPKPRGETSRSKGKQRGLDDEQSSANSTPLSSQQKADPLDWRAEVDRMLATAGRKKKRPTTPDIGGRRTKKQRVSAASFAEALRRSHSDEDIIDLTSD
ncbi:hypothetical protein DFH08DRAFT_806380 [Mycena albidolilacea]|uniref:XPG-I domain-containing protein n=1 Tax=Mycena albidolilacea TaxID=1033008 RepID=A0AAD7A5T7_9AGAR|nr:hypothetical protein DFH08DRAFT_806380 [Mycena albidolilacea]